jgi:hypothetical protein
VADASWFETFWRAMVAAGPFQGMLRTISEEELRSASRNAVEALRLDNGGFLIQPNAFKYVAATQRPPVAANQLTNSRHSRKALLTRSRHQMNFDERGRWL